MSWVKDKKQLQEFARRIDPAIILTIKSSLFWKVISYIVYVITFTGLKPKEFLEDYASALGPIHGYPEAWSATTVRNIIVHEGEHTVHARILGLGISPWLGMLPSAILYFLLPFPVFVAYFRYRMEVAADKKLWWHLLQNGAAPNRIMMRAKYFATNITSWKYGKPWPTFLAVRRCKKEAKKVIAEFQKLG